MDIFQFKQFSVQQSKLVFKITSDSLLLGALANASQGQTLLEVGTGTGVISLMIAQRNSDIKITATDINSCAIDIANSNFKMSPWQPRLQAIELDFTSIRSQDKAEFDHIVCNPPFFKNGLLSKDDVQRIARHEHSLSLIQLLNNAKDLLSNEGEIHLILPTSREQDLHKLILQLELHYTNIIRIKSKPENQSNRILVSLSKIKKQHTKESTMTIYSHDKIYHSEYQQALKSFLTIF